MVSGVGLAPQHVLMRALTSQEVTLSSESHGAMGVKVQTFEANVHAA